MVRPVMHRGMIGGAFYTDFQGFRLKFSLRKTAIFLTWTEGFGPKSDFFGN